MEVPNLGVESQSLDRSQPSQKIDADGSKMVGGQVVAVADGGAGGVKVEVGNAGGGAQVVKRKRGRPPKAQANAPLAKKSKEEDEEEDVCFICFDGGSLVLCDRRGCPKAYHPACIKRDEAFFRSKAKWNCGWHICSMCEKTAHHMCYTCTYSLCKGCIRKADYVCVRGDKGFCTVCMKTIMLIENSGQGKEETAKVDFDDKTSWEYLFKVYWIYLKGRLSLTLDELTKATNPWKSSSTIAVVEPPASHISASGRRSITSDISPGNLEGSEAKRRKTSEQTNGPPAESPSTVVCKDWASKELLDFVAHMKNGDTSVLSQFDVQALLLEYIKRNNLRDPRKKTQIICDSRLKNLFGKPRVGHIEMLKLLEFHFSIKEDSQKNTINITEKHGGTDNTQVVVNKERRNHRKGTRRTTQNKLDEYAAIDVHNMNLIYLRRNLMESLIEDGDKFHDKVVGSIVQIRISGSDQKDDMYRLVQVVGTTKVDVPYKIGDKLVDVMLEVLNLDKKEAVSIDTISNQELSEDECRRLRESIRCGLVRCFTVREIQEKAMTLQPVLLDDRMEAEMLRLNNLRNRASEKGQKKGLRECMQKLQRLKTPEERERRLREIPEVHSDPKMNPDYESDDTEEYFNNEHGEHLKPKFSWVSGTNNITPQKSAITPQKSAEGLNDQSRDLGITTCPNIEEDSSKAEGGSNMEKNAVGLGSSERPKDEVDCNGSTVSKGNLEAAVNSSISNIASESTPPFPSIPDNPSANDDVWHYRDPDGNVQGPFSIVQLQRWSTGGYFPADMMVWANREADSLLLTNVLQEHFDNREGRWHENVIHNNKVNNQNEGVNVCSAVPSSIIPVTTDALNPVNLEKLPDNRDSSGQSSGQNWNVSNYNLNCNPPIVASLTKTNESTEQLDIQNMPSSTLKGHDAHIDTHVSSPFTVADARLVDLPNPLVKKASHEDEKGQDAGDKEPSVPSSKLLVQDLGNPPSWSTTLSLVVGGAQLPETADEWGRYPPSTVKHEEWESGRASVSSLKPLDLLDHQVATTSSNMDQIMHSSPPPSSQPYNNLPSWHGLGETIEFSTLAEESVSDLLAEVDAMESRNGVPSPTSRRNSFLEDLFNGSIDDFSPTGDQGTRSDGFSSSADIQLHCQSSTTAEHLAGASHGNNANVFDLVKRSTGLHQFSFGHETKSTCVVGMPKTTNSDNMGFKWAEMGNSELHPPRQDMIDLNDSTRAEADEGEREIHTNDDRIENKAKNHAIVMDFDRAAGDTVRQPESQVGRKSKTELSGGRDKEADRIKTKVGGTKLFGGFPDAEEEEGEFVQPATAPLLPLPLPPPPPLTMGMDVVDSRRAGSETMHGNSKNTGRPSQGTTSTGRVHGHTNASRSGNTARDSHHRRSGGVDNRYSSNSPRDRGHHVEDSGGYSRSNRASWSRQSSFGGSGGGSGYSRPASKVQRLCKFYESGHCKKGSACMYLHQQDR